MRRRFLGVSGLVVIVLVMLHMQSAGISHAQSLGIVEGQVINGTDRSHVISGLIVTLHGFKAGNSISLTTVVDDLGRFRFEGIEFESDVFYTVSLSYEGALYGADIGLAVGSGPVEITVYKSTQDMSVVNGVISSVLFAGTDPISQTISVLEIVVLSNDSERTYVPGQNPMSLLRFSLPPGSRDLQVGANLVGSSVIQVDRGFGITGAVPPGEHQFQFSYVIPYDEGTFSFGKSLPYGARLARVLVPLSQGIVLSSPQLGESVETDIGTTRYSLLSAFDLPRETQLVVLLNGLRGPTFGERLIWSVEKTPYEFVVPVIVALVAFCLVMYWLIRRRNQSVSPIPLAGEALRGLLLRDMVHLENKWDEGAVDPEEYGRRKQEMIKALLSLIRSEQDNRDCDPVLDDDSSRGSS
jgi:hypothetical protein